MPDIPIQHIDPHFRQRREGIATAILAALVESKGEFQIEYCEIAVQAADALIQKLDSD